MWEVLVRTPRGSIRPRKFNLLLATILMACFAYISLLSSPTAHAATDAKWDDDTLTYKNDSYEPVDDTTNLPTDVASSPAVYQFIDTSKTPNLVHFIYFGPDTENAQAEKEATYIRYTLNPPNRYINPTGKKTITIEPVPEDEIPATSDSGSSCTIDGIGYIVCPLMNGIAEGMDFIYERIRGFLVVQPMTSDVNNPVYRIWQVSRDLANVAFVIGFLVIIYSYLVGGGFNGYEIRKIIPRLVMAAVLINVSYIICAAAVDISNIAGYGVNQLFENVRDNVLPGSATTAEINWTSVTAWVLAGGAGAVAAGLVLPGMIGGATGLWFMLAPFLLGAALLVIVTFLILAARQAIIVIAIAIAPLAFAAYILPNTEKWFEKWRSLFFTMLVMFPAFGAVFGGAQLAGEVIIRSATSIEQIILGLGVMAAPLAITPLLLKLGGGILNRFGGIINNRQKGLYDRFKNFSGERRTDAIARRQAANARARRNNDFSGFARGTQTWRRRAATNYAKANYRKEQRELNEEAARNDWHSQTGRWGRNSNVGNGQYDSHLARYNQRGRGNLDMYKRDNQLRHDQDHAHHEEHWQNTLNADAVRRGMLTDTRLSEGRSKVIQGAHEAQDERTLQTALNTDAAYANLRNMKVQTSVDSGVAQMHEKEINAHGSASLQRTIIGDSALKAMNVRTVRLEKEAAAIEGTLKQRAEDNWERITTNVNDPEFDGRLRNIRLQETEATQALEKSKKQWTELIENISAQGASADTITTNADKTIAGNLKRIHQDSAIVDRAIESAKVEQNKNLMGALKASQDGTGDPTLIKRAAGIGGETAEARIFAQATKSVVDAAVQEVKDDRYLLNQYTRSQLHTVLFKGDDLNGNQVTTEMRQAAMYELLQKKGNNDDAQVIRDAISDMGMVVDETTGEFYEPERDNDGRVVIRNGRPVADKNRKITDADEIGRRRDWQQFFVDAASGSPHSQITLSGTDKSDGEAGTLLSTIKGGFMRDALGGKFGPEKMLKADIDELKFLFTDITDQHGEYSHLTSAQKARVNKTIIESVLALQKHPTYKGQIDDRNRGVMNQIVAKLDPSYSGGTDSDGKPLFYVNDDKVLMQPPATPTGNERTFSAPVSGNLIEDRRNRNNPKYNDWEIRY